MTLNARVRRASLRTGWPVFRLLRLDYYYARESHCRALTGVFTGTVTGINSLIVLLRKGRLLSVVPRTNPW